MWTAAPDCLLSALVVCSFHTLATPTIFGMITEGVVRTHSTKPVDCRITLMASS